MGETSFLVEDYIPDRIEFDLKSKTAKATTGEGILLSVDGRYLFGAPGAGLDLEGNLTITPDDKPFAEWKDYQFGLMDERPDTIQTTAEALPQTDINGHADITIRLPDLPVTTRPLKADVALRMREPGGRAVEQNVSLPIEASQPMLGIKAEFENGAAPEGQAAGFKIIGLDKDGKLIAATGATWTLKRLARDWQWFNVDGDWRWEGVTRTSKIANGTLDLAADKPTDFTQNLSWGEYRLEIGAAGFTPVSIDFSSGYYTYDAAKADTPDTLKVALDKTDAKTGETVNVKIEARYSGKATVQIVGEGLLATQTVDVPEGGITIPFTVGEGWGTGAYVLASLYKPMDVKAKRMPSRAMGVAWFGIDREARTLGVALTPPEMMKPRQKLTVPVKIANLAPGEEAFITVAAVDVGILNLTRYNPPAPENYYFDQKRLTAELRDIYGVLIDGMQGERGKLRSGGDGGAAFTAPPPTQKPLSQYSGIVKVAADGTASVDFEIPAFNGTVRVMAVAWSKDKVGHASTDVIVRDPVVVAGTLPRFLAVGDSSRLRFDIINAEAPAGDYTLGVSIDGPVTPAGRNGDPEDHHRRCRCPHHGLRSHHGIGAGNCNGDRHAERPRRHPARPGICAGRRAEQPDGHAAHHLAADGKWRRADDQQGSAGQHVAGHRLGGALGEPAAATRCRRTRARSRPLPLWLLRTDGEPRAAAALSERTRREPEGDRRRTERADAAGRGPPRQPPVGFGLLRPVVGLWRRHQPVALLLCHRLPAPCPRKGLRCAGRRAGGRPRLYPQHGGQRA